MSRNLFSIWNKCLCFDNRATREERKKIDNFAAVREVWTMWNNTLRQFWRPSKHITVVRKVSIPSEVWLCLWWVGAMQVVLSGVLLLEGSIETLIHVKKKKKKKR